MEEMNFDFRGISSKSYGLRVERNPHRIIPARKLEIVSVPGRSGDLVFEQDAFENYNQTYDVWIDPAKTREPNMYHPVLDGVAAWLLGQKGYHKLHDSWDMDYYRMAMFIGPADFDNRLYLTGKATLTFLCKPQRWSSFGNIDRKFTVSNTRFDSFSSMPSLPYIKVTGNGAGTLEINDTTIEFENIDGYVELDSELQNVYKGTENKNNTVYIPNFPRLKAGENVVAWSGGITEVTINPRGWTL